MTKDEKITELKRLIKEVLKGESAKILIVETSDKKLIAVPLDLLEHKSYRLIAYTKEILELKEMELLKHAL